MSDENVELVRAALEAFTRGSFDEDFFAEDATMTALDGWPERGPFKGREEIRRQFERLASDWSRHAFADVEVVSHEDDWVVIAFCWTTRGAASGLEAKFEMAAAYRVDNGEFAEAHFRWNRQQALEAAGLSE
jgi:ketosteroid isomerase-like protein